MPYFIKSSFFISIFIKLIHRVIFYYGQSKLRKFVDRLKIIFSESKTVKTITVYFHKKPYFLNSISYKIVVSIVSFMSKIADFIHKIFADIINTSETKNNADYFKNSSIDFKIKIVGMFISVIPIGYMLGKLILKQVYLNEIVLAWGTLLIGFIITFIGKNIYVLKNSIIFGFFNYLVKLVKM